MTADSISAAGTALSAIVAIAVYVADRVSSNARRKADQRRLGRLIAGDIGLWIAHLRSLAAGIEQEVQQNVTDDAVQFLSKTPSYAEIIKKIVTNLPIERIERICETTDTFDASISDALATFIFLARAVPRSLESFSAELLPEELKQNSAHALNQVNMLQIQGIQIYNAIVAFHPGSPGTLKPYLIPMPGCTTSMPAYFAAHNTSSTGSGSRTATSVS